MTETSLIGFSRGTDQGNQFQAVNPSTGQNLSVQYAHASQEDVERACQLAESASLKLASLSGKEKAKFLNLVADKIDSVVDHLVEIMSAETALPELRVRGEAGRTSGQLRMFANLVEKGSWVDARIDRAEPDRKPIPKPDLRAMLHPVGPVVVFCASNFPLAFSVAGGDSASAWAAGCPVIVKAHHAHPGTALLIGKLIVDSAKELGLPEGVFSLLFGEGRTVGQSLVQNEVVKAVGFTGSRAGGRALFDIASQRTSPIPVFAEMSSVNPIFLLPELPENNVDEIAENLFASATLGVGQFCTNPGIVFFPDNSIGKGFVEKYHEKMKTFQPSCMLHKGIKDTYFQDLRKMEGFSGVNSLLSAEPSENAEECRVGTSVFQTDIESFVAEPGLSDEIFGPATLLVSYRDKGDLLEVASKLDGQLTASVFGEESNLAVYEDLIDILKTKTGRILFNQFPTGVEVCESIVHGGPYPATTDSRTTSVGTGAILRFARPVCYQGFPDEFLPDELKEQNPLGISRQES